MKKIVLITSITVCILTPLSAQADANYYLVRIYENEGEKTVDFKSWSTFTDKRATATGPELSFSYMPNKTWYTEVIASWYKYGANTLESNAWAWQNDFLLTRGQYPVDLALHTKLNRNNDTSRGIDVEFGPALQTEIGRFQVNANVFLYRTYRITPSDTIEMEYQWQGKYRWRPEFEFGVLGLGELGDWNHWSSVAQQSHRIGPILSGKYRLNDTQAIEYEASYVMGKLYARHVNVLSLRLQYAF